MFEHLDKVLSISSILVPGFILDRTLAYYSPKKDGQSVLHFFTLGLLNLAICSPLLFLAEGTKYEKGIWLALQTTIVHFVAPLAIGSGWGLVRDQQWLGKLLEKAHIKLIHPCPTAWDYKFHKVKFESYLGITLKDGTNLAGKMSSNSFASSEFAGRDLYLEETFEVDDNGNWNRMHNDDGVYISNNEIKTIRFFNGIKTGDSSA